MTMDIPATMKAVVFEKVGQWAVRQVPTPRLTGPTDLLVKVLACGICGTDNQILLDPPGAHATPGVIIGHEMVAEVVAVGDAVDAFQPGDLVVGDNICPADIARCATAGSTTNARRCGRWARTSTDSCASTRSCRSRRRSGCRRGPQIGRAHV